MNYLETLEKLPVDIIANFRKTGRTSAISPDLQQYIREISSALEISRYEFSVTRAAEKLMLRYPDLSLSTAKSRYYDAINFFHVDNNVSNEAWDDRYADWFDDFASICVRAKKFETGYKAKTKAHNIRTSKEARLKPEDFQAPVFIVSPKMKPDDFGFEKKVCIKLLLNIRMEDIVK